MSCDCPKVCEVSACANEIVIGTIDDADTDVIVQFTELITGRIKQFESTSDGSGDVSVDIEDERNFFTPNFIYELRILASNDNQCDTLPFTIDSIEYECVEVRFVQCTSEVGTVVLKALAA